jgi:hypothetical protein
MSWRATSWYLPAAIALMLTGAVAVYLAPESEVEHVVRITEVKPVEPDIWLVPAAAVAGSARGYYLTRLRVLRAERVPVKMVGHEDSNLLVRSEGLKAGDLVVASGGDVPQDSALAPVGGVSDERLITLVLEAGIQAAQARNLSESLRFVSIDYHDQWGFDRKLLGALLERAYKEFDSPRMDLAEPLIIQVQGERASVQAFVRLTAVYRGRRNYLLGDDQAPNRIDVDLVRTARGWRVGAFSGIQALGFEEEFLRILGAEVGIDLSEEEKRGRELNCMRCKQRMEERFLGNH